MGFAGNLAKKGAKAAGNAAKNKIVKTVNGGCPGAANGRHNYKTELIGNKGAKKSEKVPVTYCRNAGCGRQA